MENERKKDRYFVWKTLQKQHKKRKSIKIYVRNHLIFKPT